MSEQQTCPHCGADGYFNVRDAEWRYECHSSCNADGSEFYTGEDCYKRQLAAQAAEIDRLTERNKILEENELCIALCY